jgi:hypothetical protein
MNNLTKKYRLLPILVVCFHFIMIGQEPKKPQLTIAELTEIAKKYGMENQVSKNTALIYYDRKFVEQHFQNESHAQKSSNESDKFLEKTINVRTYKDFFNLMDASPFVKEGFLKSHNWNEETYRKYVDSFSKYKWRIYRDRFGGISFYRADTKLSKEELSQGKRIDYLPKIRE